MRFKGKRLVAVVVSVWMFEIKVGEKAGVKCPRSRRKQGRVGSLSTQQTVDPEGPGEKKNTLVAAALIRSDMSHSLVMEGSTIPKCCRAASLCCFRIAGSNERMGVIAVDTMRTTSPRDGAPR